MREAFRRRVKTIDRDGDTLGHAAVGVDSQYPDASATIIPALTTREAVPTIQDGLDANPVAHAEAAGVRPDLQDFTTKLVSQDARIRDEGVVTTIGVHV